MSGASGIVVSCEFRFQFVPDRKAPQVPVIVLTRLWNPTFHQLTLDNGAQAHFVKNRTSVQDLDKAIEQALAAVRSNNDDGNSACPDPP